MFPGFPFSLSLFAGVAGIAVVIVSRAWLLGSLTWCLLWTLLGTQALSFADELLRLEEFKLAVLLSMEHLVSLLVVFRLLCDHLVDSDVFLVLREALNWRRGGLLDDLAGLVVVEHFGVVLEYFLG